MISQIKKILKDKNNNGYYGFIRSLDDGNDYYFKKSDINNLEVDDITIGDKVEFEPIDINGKRCVKNLKLFESKPNFESDNSISYEKFEEGVFKELKQVLNIDDYSDFEDATFYLLKLLGIHKIFQFDRQSQAGKADGFFILENMAVMYDCTLNNNFEEFKEEQIENYINKLSQKSQITFDIKRLDGSVAPKTLQISGKTKQVWIITKGESNEIRDFDSIKIKEISVHDLLNIFMKRMKDSTYDSERLVNDLMFIGK